eukprot:m.20530 g.20530  ORF g.20530 m.20530 type:complete len:234 (-) comp12977_c0_seq1:159-860(-)
MMMVVLPSLICCGVFTFMSSWLDSHPSIRKSITQRKLWKLQLFCHPFIIFSFLYFGRGSLLASVCVVPFVFNFAVEPFDLPKDSIVRICYYLHHIAPVLCTLLYLDINNYNGGDTQRRVFGQAMMFAHAWALHTVSSIDHFGWMNKQTMFWPYMLIGFCVACFWWSNLLNNGPTRVVAIEAIPVGVQYVCRWGLYLRLKTILPLPPDQFETLKQPVELGAFLISFLLVYTFFA